MCSLFKLFPVADKRGSRRNYVPEQLTPNSFKTNCNKRKEVCISFICNHDGFCIQSRSNMPPISSFLEFTKSGERPCDTSKEMRLIKAFFPHIGVCRSRGTKCWSGRKRKSLPLQDFSVL